MQVLSAQPTTLPDSSERPSIFAENELPYQQQETGADIENLAGLDIDVVLAALSTSTVAQLNTGLDEQSLRKHLSLPWSPESALKDCK